MRRRIGITLLLLLLILLGGGGFYMLYRWAKADTAPTATAATGPAESPTSELILGDVRFPNGALATLVHFERTVKLKRADELVWEDAEEEMDLYDNDGVRTFDHSFAEILFGHGDLVEVDENTLIIVTGRQARDAGDISLALLSPTLLQRIAEAPMAEQERLLQQAMDSREVRVVKIIGGESEGDGVRVGVKTLDDQSNSIVARSGSVKIVGPDGTEVILHEDMATTLGPGGVLAAPRALLAAPALGKPPNGALITYQRKIPSVKLSWRPVDGAAAYQIVVARDGDFNTVFVDEMLRETSLVTHNMESGSYYWRVKAQDEDGIEGAFSSTRTIKTAHDDLPPELAISYPPDMYISPGPEITVQGKTSRDAVIRINGRAVPVGRDGGFNHTVTLNEGTMLITVEAVDAAGNVEYAKRLVTYRGKRSTVATLPEKR